jgi:hypothetical protein
VPKACQKRAKKQAKSKQAKGGPKAGQKWAKSETKAGQKWAKGKWGKIPTLPIAKIISAKNARAWVSMLSYLKKLSQFPSRLGWIGCAI